MNEHDPEQPPSPRPDPAADDAAATAHPDTRPADDQAAGVTVDPAQADGAKPAEAETRPQRWRLAAGILVVVLIVLAVGEVWLFTTQGSMSDQATQVSNLSDQMDTLRGKVDSLDQKVATLSSKVGTIDGKVKNLAKAQASASPPPPALPAGFAGRISKLEAGLASLSTTTLADHAAIAKLQQQGGDLPKLAAKAQRLAAIAQASLNLENGLKLGTIPGEPPALAHYADTAPPTLAGLKQSFPHYADAAARAAGDKTPKGGFWRKVKGRIESMVTLRHKDEVLVGSSAAGTLGKAQMALDDDDLTGAITALKSLPPAAATAMKPWTKRAKGLLAARSALAKLAEQV